MQKNFLSKPLIVNLASILLLSSTAFTDETTNPNFFWTPSGFVEKSQEWNESEFGEMWKKYPVYLKLDTYKSVSPSGPSPHREVRDEIERIEYYEQGLSGDVKATVIARLHDRLPKNTEKLVSVRERYTELKNGTEGDFENVAQLFHLALCYNTPIGETLDALEEIFGSGTKNGSDNIVYFFGTGDGGFRFEFFMEDKIVTHISFTFEQ